jgi:hypothetical protein
VLAIDEDDDGESIYEEPDSDTPLDNGRSKQRGEDKCLPLLTAPFRIDWDPVLGAFVTTGGSSAVFGPPRRGAQPSASAPLRAATDTWERPFDPVGNVKTVVTAAVARAALMVRRACASAGEPGRRGRGGSRSGSGNCVGMLGSVGANCF